MKYIVPILLALLVVGAPAQVAGGKVVRGAPSLASDNDDSGVLPFTLTTPIGEASGLIIEGIAFYTVGGFVMGPYAPSEVHGASVVDGHLCYTVMVTGAFGYQHPMVLPVPAGDSGPDGTLEGAVAEYKANKAAAGGPLFPCP